MEITMQQQPFQWNYTYKFSNETIIAKADKGTFLKKRKVVLYENEQIIIQAIKKDFKKKWLTYIPIVNGFIHEEFNVYMDKNVGEIKNRPEWKQNRIECTIHDSHYVVYKHTGGFNPDAYSVYRDDNQIGLVSKSKEATWGVHTYKGLFHDDTNAPINHFLMVFMDVFWNGSGEVMGETYARSKRQYSWGFDRKFGRPLNEDWKVNERS